MSELISKVGVSSREEVAGYWRQERAPRRRLTRTLRGLVAGPALKLAGGGAAVGIAATGVVWVAMAANTGGGSPLAVSVTATPTQATLPATPAPAAQGSLSSSRPAGCPTSARAELTMFNSSFAGVSVVGANLAYSGFGASDMTGADLRNVDLIRAQLQGTDFTNANLLGADLTNAITRGARWSNTTCLDGTNSDTNGGTCVGTISVSDYWLASGPGGWSPPRCSTNGQPPGLGVLCAPDLYENIAVDADGRCHAPFYQPPVTDLRWADLRNCKFAGAALDPNAATHVRLDQPERRDIPLRLRIGPVAQLKRAHEPLAARVGTFPVWRRGGRHPARALREPQHRAFAVVFDDAQRTRRPDAAPPDLLKDDRRVGFEVCHQQSLTSTGCNH